MDKGKFINSSSQEDINKIWRNRWLKAEADKVDINKMLGRNRLFLESYPIFKKYFSQDLPNILDAGGGTGRYSFGLVGDIDDLNITIIDILPESLRLIENFKNQLGIDNIKVKREDILSLTFPDNHFDVVFSDAVIQHLPNYRDAIKELTRVIRPGGRIIISVVNYWNFHTFFKFLDRLFGRGYEYGFEKSFTRSELKELFRENKINVIAEDGFYPAYGVYRLKKINRSFKLAGKIINRLTKIFDNYTNRFFSRRFGFEILIVGEKSSL